MARSAVCGWLLPAVLLAACTVMPPPQSAAGTADASSLVDAVVAESNRARAADGAGPLRNDASLQRAAQSHADELAVRGVLDHGSSTPGRRTMAERISVSGVSLREAGENLAKLHAQNGDVAEATIRMWLASAGHRRNLLNRSFTHTGVGVARDSSGDWYLVQLYVLPFGDPP